jgi:hypothetical protein
MVTMPLTAEQQSFLKSQTCMTALARWVLTDGIRPIADSTRRAAHMRQYINPESMQIVQMLKHLYDLDDGSLAGLINVYRQACAATAH